MKIKNLLAYIIALVIGLEITFTLFLSNGYVIDDKDWWRYEY